MPQPTGYSQFLSLRSTQPTPGQSSLRLPATEWEWRQPIFAPGALGGTRYTYEPTAEVKAMKKMRKAFKDPSSRPTPRRLSGGESSRPSPRNLAPPASHRRARSGGALDTQADVDFFLRASQTPAHPSQSHPRQAIHVPARDERLQAQDDEDFFLRASQTPAHPSQSHPRRVVHAPAPNERLQTQGDVDFFNHFSQQPAHTPRPQERLIPMFRGRELLMLPDLVKGLRTAQRRNVTNVIRAYAVPKMTFGVDSRRRQTIEETLDAAERQFPQYFTEFGRVREELGLRPSRAQGTGASVGATAPAPAPTPARAQAQTQAQAPAQRTRVSTRPPVARNETHDFDLPVYALEDPDPTSTHLLSERLAAEMTIGSAAGTPVPTITETAPNVPITPGEAPPAYEPPMADNNRRRSMSVGASDRPAQTLLPPAGHARRGSFGNLVKRRHRDGD